MKMFMSGVTGGISECINKTNLPDMNREFRKLMAFQEYRNRPHKSMPNQISRFFPSQALQSTPIGQSAFYASVLL